MQQDSVRGNSTETESPPGQTNRTPLGENDHGRKRLPVRFPAGPAWPPRGARPSAAVTVR